MMENFAAATAAMAGGGSANGGGEVSKPEGPEANGQAGGTSASPQQPAAASTAAAANTGGGANNSGSGSTTTTTQQTQPYPGSTLNVHPFLSSMVIYTQPMKFQGFDVAEEENLAFKMSSFPETTALGKKNQESSSQIMRY